MVPVGGLRILVHAQLPANGEGDIGVFLAANNGFSGYALQVGATKALQLFCDAIIK